MGDNGQFRPGLADAVYEILLELPQSLHEMLITLVVLILLQLGNAIFDVLPCYLIAVSTVVQEPVGVFFEFYSYWFFLEGLEKSRIVLRDMSYRGDLGHQCWLNRNCGVAGAAKDIKAGLKICPQGRYNDILYFMSLHFCLQSLVIVAGLFGEMSIEILAIDSHAGLVLLGLVHLAHLFFVEPTHDLGDLFVSLGLVPADQHTLQVHLQIYQHRHHYLISNDQQIGLRFGVGCDLHILWTIIICLMYNPFQHSSLSSYSNYHEWYPQSGFNNTRTLNQLELSIPINLLNDYPLSSPNLSSQTRYPASQKYTSFPTRQSRPASNVLPKENPFLTARPYRLSDRNNGTYGKNGLTGWEKRRYLERFSTENSDIEQPSSRYAFPIGGRQQQKKRADIGKVEKANPVGSSHLKKLFTFQTDNQREQPLSHHQGQYSFSNDDPSLQLAYNPTYTRSSKDNHHNDEFGQDSAMKKIIRKPSDRSKKYEEDQESLINKLDSNLEHRSLHLKTTNSKIVDYPGEQSQYQEYQRPNFKTSQKSQFPSRLPILQQEPRGSKDSQDSDPFRSALANSLQNYPSAIEYRKTKYELIRLI